MNPQHPKLALFSDLDRTILPNGPAPESVQARPLLNQLLQDGELFLAYVSGRNRALLQQAIAQYSIPLPYCAVGDVGTTIYHIKEDTWYEDNDWQKTIAPDWQGATHGDLQHLLHDLDMLQLQEATKQNSFKLSYYLSLTQPATDLITEIQARLTSRGIHAEIIWSIDEEAQIGLLDILPASATKLHAIEFLMEKFDLPGDVTVFSGDSGNDLPVVNSGRLHSVLVRNAHADVINEARAKLKNLNKQHMLYHAQGDFLSMNGNYSAGVLEGLAHYIPPLSQRLQQLLQKLP